MTITWGHYNPVKVHAGRGALRSLPEMLFGDRWLLVTTQGFTCRGLTAKIQHFAPNINFEVCDHTTPNPELDDLEAIATCYKNRQLDGIIAIGGGSVIDAAKVLASTIPSEVDSTLTAIFRQGEKLNLLTRLPLIAIPTTSGTGAEVTPFATVWDAGNHKKYSLTGNKVFPDIALLDPELTLTLTEKDTLYPGLDAVSHALESLWNINRTPISQAYAIHALELSEQALPQVVCDPSNILAREHMQQASILAGYAISQTYTAIAHSISYPLTSYFNVPHGLACSFTLPRIIEHYLQDCNGEIAQSLLRRIMFMLDRLDLSRHIESYVNYKDILSLRAEMFHSDRIGNYSGVINTDLLDQLLSTN